MAPNPQSSFDPSTAALELRQQFTNPSDVFSLLLIIGPDVIATALAQLAGGIVTPVTFSFGWVAYGLSALITLGGENKLMPSAADGASIVINGQTGYVRNNSSWVIGRMIRDYQKWIEPTTLELCERNKEVKFAELKERARKEGQDPSSISRPTKAGLCVAVYQPSSTKTAGGPTKDLIYYSGFVTTVLQLGIAAAPCGKYGDWGTLIISVCGICLALITGSLPQWAKEKWAARHNTHKHVVLTRGNGSEHAIIILGNGRGLDFEDLAGSSPNIDTSTGTETKFAILLLAIGWMLLLIAATGLKQHAWFLLGVGGLGMLHNMAVASLSRRPDALGIHLDFVEVIGNHKVMEALFLVEERYPGIGASMLATFFPGTLRKDEEQRWEGFAAVRNTP